MDLDLGCPETLTIGASEVQRWLDCPLKAAAEKLNPGVGALPVGVYVGRLAHYLVESGGDPSGAPEPPAGGILYDRLTPTFAWARHQAVEIAAGVNEMIENTPAANYQFEYMLEPVPLGGKWADESALDWQLGGRADMVVDSKHLGDLKTGSNLNNVWVQLGIEGWLMERAGGTPKNLVVIQSERWKEGMPKPPLRYSKRLYANMRSGVITVIKELEYILRQWAETGTLRSNPASLQCYNCALAGTPTCPLSHDKVKTKKEVQK